ncbi:hypothetical protein AB0E69_34105 [Kribbella sp. NPDC026611]|uniref:hypothetical protein n=1 Tax=Kribbella sp. NPDC026611 TaxID=3154911 RepID=UPI00340721FC
METLQPVGAAELLDHVNGLLLRSRVEDQRVALRAVLATGLRSRTTTGTDLVRILTEFEGGLTRDLNRQQRIHLNATLEQLDQLRSQPEVVREGNRRHRQWQVAQHGIAGDPRLGSDVATGMAGTVTASTQRPRGATVRYRDGLGTDSGNHSFGDGAATNGTPGTDTRSAFAAAGPRMYEGVAFAPATQPSFRQQAVQTGRLWWKKTENGAVRDGDKPLMVPGPNGLEPGVRVSYAFDPHQLGQRRRQDLPLYPSVQPNQPGNFLQVQAVLPASVAERLREAIRQDPAAARDFAEQALRVNCGVDERTWTGADGVPPMRPPWDGVPRSEPIHLVSTDLNGATQVEELFFETQSADHDPGLAAQVQAYTSQGHSGQVRRAADNGARPPGTATTLGRAARGQDQRNHEA